MVTLAPLNDIKYNIKTKYNASLQPPSTGKKTYRQLN